MDVLGSIHISGGIGFGLRMEGEMMVGNVPINLAFGEKIDILAADWGDGEIVIGGGMARGIDLGIKEFLSIGGGSSVFHPYTETEQCTCKSLTFEDMLDCPAANTSSGLSGEVGIGVEAYLGIGGNLGASIDLVQIDRGLKKILNSIADFWDNLF